MELYHLFGIEFQLLNDAMFFSLNEFASTAIFHLSMASFSLSIVGCGTPFLPFLIMLKKSITFHSVAKPRIL